jgi:hypothetical protein
LNRRRRTAGEGPNAEITEGRAQGTQRRKEKEREGKGREEQRQSSEQRHREFREEDGVNEGCVA